MTDANNALLPNGLADTLSPEAGRENAAIQALLGAFRGYGFSLVKPPLLEFEDGLTATGPGKVLDRQTFRLMDPESGRMMGLRPDMTPQIARIAASRYRKANRPLRLCYTGDVLRVRGSQLRPARQFVQVGAELVGLDSPAVEAEILLTAIEALHEAGMTEFTLSLSLPGLVADLVSACKLSNEQARALEQAASSKNTDYLNGLDSKLAKIIAGLLSVSVWQGQKLESSKLPKALRLKLDDFQDMMNRVSKGLSNLGYSGVTLVLDIVEGGYEYQRGVAFTFYGDHGRQILGRGGSYEFDNGTASETACGVTFYLDSLFRCLPHDRDTEKWLAVPDTLDWAQAQKLRRDGWIVFRVSDLKTLPKFCTHVYKDGAIKQL